MTPVLPPPLWSRSITEPELPSLAAEIARALASAEVFCLWLQGPLGAGKTAASREILRALGLPAHIAVTSPTYTYVNEYEISGRWYAHLDLYRLPKGMTPEDLGLVDSRTFAGYLVEWPEVLPDSPVLEPTHVLRLAFDADGGARRTASFSLRGAQKV